MTHALWFGSGPRTTRDGAEDLRRRDALPLAHSGDWMTVKRTLKWFTFPNDLNGTRSVKHHGHSYRSKQKPFAALIETAVPARTEHIRSALHFSASSIMHFLASGRLSIRLLLSLETALRISSAALRAARGERPCSTFRLHMPSCPEEDAMGTGRNGQNRVHNPATHRRLRGFSCLQPQHFDCRPTRDTTWSQETSSSY